MLVNIYKRYNIDIKYCNHSIEALSMIGRHYFRWSLTLLKSYQNIGTVASLAIRGSTNSSTLWDIPENLLGSEEKKVSQVIQFMLLIG